MNRTNRGPPLQSIDLHQAAHQHLCSSLLKIKGIAESPNLPELIKPVPKPELSEEERIALHNVTSALCNRKQVKDVIEEAIMGTCIALRVPMPDKRGKAKGKNAKQEKEEQVVESQKETSKTTKEKPSKKTKQVPKVEADESDASWVGLGSDAGLDPAEKADSDAEEKAFSRYEGLLGSSSEDEGDAGDVDKDADSRAKSIRGPSDYFSGSSAEEESEGGDEQSSEDDEDDEDEEDGESDGSGISPPPKRVKSKTGRSAPQLGNSTFLPSLMGGYISGSDSEASDIDVGPTLKKNRRGQRARQAIWEKKFKKEANHVKKQIEMSARDQGWDMKKGAVGDEESGPWKKGIRNPFEKKQAQEGVHPDRQVNFGQSNPPPQHRKAPEDFRRDERHGPQRPPPSQQNEFQPQQRENAGYQRDEAPRPAPKPKPKKDDEGLLHASWEAAKKAKEAAQKVAFQGKKITFD